VEIKVRPDGPYLVKGPIRLIDNNGNEFDVEDGKTIALCRCGGSNNKPFCDSTHGKIGFAAATHAVALADAAAIEGEGEPPSEDT
jgi:CDGSH-type Zn-finger protein